MDIQKLKYFLSVAEYLNFSKAAQEQYVSQSTITTQVQNFEDTIGIKLFERNSKKVELTKAGRLLKSDLTKLVEDYDRAIRRAKAVSTGKNTISFGCTRPVDWMQIPALIRLYSQEHTDVQFDISTEQFARLTRKLVNGTIDVIFVDINYVKNMQSVKYFSLYKDHMVVILPTGHPLTQKEILEPADLSQYSIYMMGYVDSPNDQAISSFDEALNKNNVDTLRMLRVSSREEIINAVSCGTGIGLIPKSLIGAGSEYTMAKEINIDPVICEYVCAYMENEQNRHIIQPFLAFIKEFYSNYKP